jgi:putative phosphoesterase
MKIALLSDSHHQVGYTRELILFLKNKGANYLIHAGDLCSKENLELMKNSKMPYVSVFGNNDARLIEHANEYNIYQEPYNFKIQNIKFRLMHLPFYMQSDADITIYGHTHIFQTEFKNNQLYINPGEVCAREKPLIEGVLLEIKENEYIISYYYKHPQAKEFEKKEIRYERS